MPNNEPDALSLERRLLTARAELEERLRAGVLTSAEDLRDQYPDVWDDPDSAIELAYAEYVLRAGRGETPRPDDWYRRFPQWRDRLGRLFAIYDAFAGGGTDSGRSSPDTGDPRRSLKPGPVAQLPGYDRSGRYPGDSNNWRLATGRK